MTTKDKIEFDQNLTTFYEKHGFVQGISEALRNMPFGKEYKRLDALRTQAIEEMKNLSMENERLLGLNGADE